MIDFAQQALLASFRARGKCERRSPLTPARSPEGRGRIYGRQTQQFFRIVLWQCNTACRSSGHDQVLFLLTECGNSGQADREPAGLPPISFKRRDLDTIAADKSATTRSIGFGMA